MSLFDIFRGRPPPPPPTQPAIPKMTVALCPAPRFQPLPAPATTPLDATLSTAWLQFQQTMPGATFDQFLAALKAETDRLSTEIATVSQHLDHYR